MSRIVVVHFSRDGHTRAIAREIAKACGADTEAITESSDRAGLWGYLRSALEALLGIAPTLASTKTGVRRGDLVVIGTPIWFWNLSSPVRSYILAHRGRFSRVAFFCTCGGSGSAKVFRDMEALCGRAPVATLALTEAQCTAGAHKAAMAAFVRALQRRGAVVPDAHGQHAEPV
jgi:flavodoxin